MRLESHGVPTPVRRPAVAGRFYPSDAGELRALVEWAIAHRLGPGHESVPAETRYARVAISPHAGLVYSGPIAAHATESVVGNRVIVIVGPNHSGVGPVTSLSAASIWRTPLGDLHVSDDVRSAILERCPFAVLDDRAHATEHSIEVQLPFIVVCSVPGTSIVPISLRAEAVADAESLGNVIGDLIATSDVSLLATTDLSHYLTQEPARILDGRTVSDILAGDASRLIEDYRDGVARLCGLAPAIVAMVAARRAGLSDARVLGHCTSADTGGPASSVVGYAAIGFFSELALEGRDAG